MGVAMDISSAFLAGRPQLLKRDADLYRKLIAWKTGGTSKPDAETLSQTLDMLAALHWLGDDIAPALERIASVRSYRDPEAKLLRRIAIAILALRTQPAPACPLKPGKRVGHVMKENSRPQTWYSFLEKASPEEALDLALTPDWSQFWNRLFRPFVLPLALLVHERRRSRGEPSDFGEVFRFGPYPSMRGTVVYERVQRQLDFFISEERVVIDPKKRETWPSFDALEIRGEDLYAYHFLTCQFKAPLLYTKMLDTFSFLDGVAFSWRLVEENVSSKVWMTIQRLRAGDRCTHVVVYDAAEAASVPGHTEAAAKDHDLRLQTASFLQV